LINASEKNVPADGYQNARSPGKGQHSSFKRQEEGHVRPRTL
jgi:hypothetical protein